MNRDGLIYEGTEEKPVKPEDAARLDGYLRGRAESDEAAFRAKIEELEEA